MIQRIQTIWFFLAAVASALLFCIPCCHLTVGSNGESAFTLTAIGLQGMDGTTLRYAWGILTFSIVQTILPIVALLSYKNRKRQKLLGTCLLLSLLAERVFRLSEMGSSAVFSSFAQAAPSVSAGSGISSVFLVICCLLLLIGGRGMCYNVSVQAR